MSDATDDLPVYDAEAVAAARETPDADERSSAEGAPDPGPDPDPDSGSGSDSGSDSDSGSGSDPAPAVVGVLLAAGTSSRFGDANKLTADLDGEPLVRHAARSLLDADLREVVAVIGHEADAVRAALDDLPVRFVHNPDHEAGLSTSVARGVRAVRGEADEEVGDEGEGDEEESDEGEGDVEEGDEDARGAGTDGRGVDDALAAGADAAVFLPGDMPGVDPGTVGLLVDAYRAGLGTALAAACDGRRGNPVLFDRRQFAALLAVEGDVGGRPVLAASEDAALVETGDPGVHADVDTVADLRRRR